MNTTETTTAGPDVPAILTAVEEQRSRLINVVGVVQCIQIAVRNERPDELEGAVELLEEELQRILEALEERPLMKAAAAAAGGEEAQS